MRHLNLALVLATAAALSAGSARGVGFEFAPIVLQSDPTPEPGRKLRLLLRGLAGERRRRVAVHRAALGRQRQRDGVSGLWRSRRGRGGGGRHSIWYRRPFFSYVAGNPINASGDIVFMGSVFEGVVFRG